MANALYPSAKVALLTEAFGNLSSATLKAILVDDSYTYSASHNALDDLTGTLGTAEDLTGATVTAVSANAVFDADDLVFTGIAASETVQAVIIYLDTGTPSTSLLLGFFDTGVNLPLTTTGADINVVWSSGSSKIFAF